MDLFPRGACLPIGLRQGGPKPGFGTFQVHHLRRGRTLARPRIVERAVGVLDGGPERQAAPREVDLLPAPQLLAQASVAPCPGRLPLERPALLLDLEDDVVDAGQVLLRRLELELGRPPPRLVLGDAGRLLEQLPALGRARPQYLTDTPLLDYRVGFHAHARVHQEVLHVPQSADLPVDEVLALPGSVQAPPHLDVAPDEGGIEIAVVRLGRRQLRRGHPQRRNGPRLRRRPADGTSIRACVVAPVAAARAVHRTGRGTVAVAVGDPACIAARKCRRTHGAGQGGQRGGDVGQPQPHLGGGGRPARVAPAEDHVLHPLATQTPGALLTQDPRDGVDDVALAAAVRADDGRDAAVERELGALREALEAGYLQVIQTHRASLPGGVHKTSRTNRTMHHRTTCSSGWERPDVVRVEANTRDAATCDSTQEWLHTLTLAAV